MTTKISASFFFIMGGPSKLKWGFPRRVVYKVGISSFHYSSRKPPVGYPVGFLEEE